MVFISVVSISFCRVMGRRLFCHVGNIHESEKRLYIHQRAWSIYYKKCC